MWAGIIGRWSGECYSQPEVEECVWSATLIHATLIVPEFNATLARYEIQVFVFALRNRSNVRSSAITIVGVPESVGFLFTTQGDTRSSFSVC